MLCSIGYWVTRKFERATVLPVPCCWLKPTRQSSMLEFVLYRNAQTGKGTLVECGDFYFVRWTNHIIFETKWLKYLFVIYVIQKSSKENCSLSPFGSFRESSHSLVCVSVCVWSWKMLKEGRWKKKKGRKRQKTPHAQLTSSHSFWEHFKFNWQNPNC